MEYKPKNRDWVKNAAIVFLSLLLVLTFFSNTWMNRSLPEVATQNVASGSITARVRGTGTVTAVGTHTVKAAETREIRAVMVKVGQSVEAGDVLFILGQGDATALETAQENLRQLEISYQRAAINAPTSDYALERRRIQLAQNDYDKAKAEADSAWSKLMGQMTEEERNQLEQLRTKIDYATSVLEQQNTTADTELARADSAVSEAKARYNILQAEVLRRGLENDTRLLAAAPGTGLRVVLLSAVPSEIPNETPNETPNEAPNETPNEAPNETPKEAPNETPNETPNEAPNGEGGGQLPSFNAEPNAENGGSAASSLLGGTSGQTGEQGKDTTDSSTSDAVSSAGLDMDDQKLIDERNAAKKAMVAAETYRATLTFPERDAQAAYVAQLEQEYQAMLDKAGSSIQFLAYYNAAVDRLEEAELALRQLQSELNAKQASDALNQQLSYLDLLDYSQQIEKAKQKIADLSGGEQNQITAPVAGTVLTVECTPGDTKAKNDVLATLEVPDMGYTLSFTVTNDQARRLKVGDPGSVSNYYWGNAVNATLSSIKTDPKNPQTNKLLTFDLDGDVTVGAELTLSVGSRSATYDTVVPRSAIRTDANGSFVLVVESRSSPLGNRYTAKRAAVEILAEDDVSAAVTGSLSNGDYVITTSSAPVKNGDLVRLSDGT